MSRKKVRQVEAAAAVSEIGSGARTIELKIYGEGRHNRNLATYSLSSSRFTCRACASAKSNSITSCVSSRGTTGFEIIKMSSTGDEDDVRVPAETRHQSSGSEYEDERQNHSHDEDYESEREGRFHGPDSSWRFYTKEDRAIAASIDQAENNDLSAHLYNAHAWKQRLRDANRIDSSLPWQSKHRWIRLEDNGKPPWVPPTAWTAWPMKPNDVPRSREQWGIPLPGPEEDADTFRKNEPWRPSLHLHEEIKAVFMRTAKEAYRMREQAVAKEETQIDRTTSSKTVSTRSGSVESVDSDNDEKLQPKNVKKEMQSDDDQSPESVEEYKGDSEEYDTSFLLDDGLADSILRPTMHHITSKLDDLLVGLHKSRLGHRQDRSRSRGRSTDTPARGKSRSRANSSAGVPSKRKRAVSDLTLPDAEFPPDSGSDDDQSKVSTRTGRAARRGAHYRMPGPRDWSEVLGVAAMVGWDQEILDRAARRCAATFRESMTMRIMTESSFGNAQEQVVEYTPQMVPPIGSASKDEEESEEESKGQCGFACPEATCPRHQEPYESRWRLREHMKRAHKMSKVDVERLVPPISAPSTPKAQDSDDLTSDEESQGTKMEIEDFQGSHSVRLDGFMQPVDVRLRRAKDKRPRRGSSSRRRKAVDKDEGL